MSDINVVNIIGRLTNEPITKQLNTGSEIVEFSIANNYYVSSKKTNEANFFECVAYGNTAKIITNYASKGSQIAILGTLRQERWQDKNNNQTRSKVRIIVQSVQLLDKKENNNATTSNDYDDDFNPFD